MSRGVWAAFEANDVEAFETALKAVPNPNALLVNSENPLACQAAKLGRRGLLAAALRADAWGVTAADAGLRTPLHFAALAGDVEAVRLVLELKPERVRPEMLIKQQDASKMTVLHAAVLSGNEELVLLLLDVGHGAAIDMQGAMGLFPLHLACSKGMVRAVEQMCRQERGAPAAAHVEPDGSTLLHRATVEGHEGVVEALLRSGLCDPNAADADGSTALHLACAMGLGNIVDVLLPVTDQDLVDRQNKRPMDWWVPNEHSDAETCSCNLVHVSIAVTPSGRATLHIYPLAREDSFGGSLVSSTLVELGIAVAESGVATVAIRTVAN